VRGAVEQRRTEVALDLPQRPAQRRLGDVQPGRRPPEMPLPTQQKR
jgi:hypothetical protein